MTKPIIDAHPSLVIATNSLKNKLLLSVYDSGYRGGEGPYPLSANVIGGNPDIEYDEKGPRQVLEREIIEEFDPNFQLKKLFLIFGILRVETFHDIYLHLIQHKPDCLQHCGP
mgnify:CR=1 FL=1